MFARIALRVARIPMIRSPFCWPAVPFAEAPVVRFACAHRPRSAQARIARLSRRRPAPASSPSLLDTAMRRLADAGSGELTESKAGA